MCCDCRRCRRRRRRTASTSLLRSNNWEQCAIAHYPDTSDWFPFYYCIEANGAEGVTKLPTQKCAELANLDYQTLETCVNGEEGKALQKKAYVDTPSDHQYVPWVVINGKLWNQVRTLRRRLPSSPSPGRSKHVLASRQLTGVCARACFCSAGGILDRCALQGVQERRRHPTGFL